MVLPKGNRGDGAAFMRDRRLTVFLLEALNALGASFYFNYLFFFLKAEFGFTSFQNLLVCALNGFVFIFSAIYGGKFGQARGYLVALKVGCGIMALALVAGAWWQTVGGILVSMVVWTFGMCFTWPNLEALTCDNQKPAALPKMIGVYNIVWSGAFAVAYFFGGAIAEAAGWASIFWIPAIIHLIQIIVAHMYEPHWKAICAETRLAPAGVLDEGHPRGRAFLKMAWLANPFAYIAINAVIPLIPDLAARLNFSPKMAGFFCSIWFFSRTVTFGFLAWWEGWHYRISHLLVAYVGTVICFAGMLLSSSIWLIVGIQIAFGWCMGLIYYSSLYYSMHVGETKGEHGGFHEAAIGAGIFAGPAIGAASIYFFPANPQSSVAGVALALMAGLAGLIRLARK